MNSQTQTRTGNSNSLGSSNPASRHGSEDSRTGTEDLSSLRTEIESLKKTMTDYAKAGGDAVETAKKTTADVAGQVRDTTSELANAASEHAKTFASELERMGRANPLGAIAGAVLVGVVIGMIGRGRS